VFTRRPTPLQIWQKPAKFNCTTTANHTGQWILLYGLGAEFFLLTQGGILDTAKGHENWPIIMSSGAGGGGSLTPLVRYFSHAQVLRTPYKASLLVRTLSSRNSRTTGYEILQCNSIVDKQTLRNTESIQYDYFLVTCIRK